MFKFLKDKIKATVEKFTKKEEQEETPQEEENAPLEHPEVVDEFSHEKIQEENLSEHSGELENENKEETQKEKTREKDIFEDVPTTKTHEQRSQEEAHPSLSQGKKNEERALVDAVVEEEKSLAQEVARFDEKLKETTESLVKETATEALVADVLAQEHASVKKKEEPSKKQEKHVREEQPEEKTKEKEQPQQKKSFFKRLAEGFTKTTITEEKFEEFFWELEIGLLESNVAVEVIEKLKEDLKQALLGKSFATKQLATIIYDQLKASLNEVLSFPVPNLIEMIKRSEKPYVIVFVGINGTGKTTTIAKMIAYLKKHHFSVVVAAADTFRAAAIDQLKEHTEKLGVKLIKHDYGADPAAVGYDAVQYAKAKGIDVVLIDTAGRMHANTNLMDELKKIIRVTQPHLKLFVGDALTGNDCIEQAQQFQEIGALDGLVLSKVDADEKGGTVLSVAYVTKKPIFFLGVGQSYEDFIPFNKQMILERLGFS